MIDKVTSSQGVYPTTRVAPTITGEQRQQASSQKQTSSQKDQAEYRDVKPSEMKDIVESMNKFMEPSSSSLKFEFHEDLNEYYVTVVDEVTKEVIREIPPKKLLDMYAAMTDYIGLMVDRKI